ncbi:MAG: thioredoxin family protein [Clostridia bacterium]|nr:thioredoxin family protein [Clostridia bacterium]
MNVMNYKEELKGLCCVEVSGEDCANCLTLMPILKEICDSRGDLRLVHVEATAQILTLLDAWKIEKVPTILLMDDGEIFARCHGYQPEEILELWIDAKMEEHKALKN